MKHRMQESDLFNYLNVEGLTSSEIRAIAYECGFVKRTCKKIGAVEFLVLMCIDSQKGSPSYNDLASRLDSIYGNMVSKQAVWKRVNDSCSLFFQAILAKLIEAKLSSSMPTKVGVCYGYKRVLIQDSTIIRLPLRLFKIFSGVANASSSVCSARIQGVYDLLSGCFVSFSIDPYSKNDIKAAPSLALKEGDLALRDRGYFTIGEVERHMENRADCIFRYKHKTTFIHPTYGYTINLVEFLCPGEKLEMVVCLNNKEKTSVRLTAIPVNDEVANRRRQKAKKENKGHNPSKDILFLMSWTIFVTTIPADKVDFSGIFNLYRLRWRIETIFKTWKSHMNFAKVHNVSECQLQVILCARLIMVVICTQVLYQPCKEQVKQNCGKELSMIKFCNFLMTSPDKIYSLVLSLRNDSAIPAIILKTISRYACYDKRKRANFNLMQTNFLLS